MNRAEEDAAKCGVPGVHRVENEHVKACRSCKVTEMEGNTEKDEGCLQGNGSQIEESPHPRNDDELWTMGPTGNLYKIKPRARMN